MAEFMLSHTAEEVNEAVEYFKKPKRYVELGTKTIDISTLYNGSEGVVLPGFPPFEVGDMVKFTLNGVEYSLEAFDFNGFTMVGDSLEELGNGGQYGWSLVFGRFISLEPNYVISYEDSCIPIENAPQKFFANVNKNGENYSVFPDSIMVRSIESEASGEISKFDLVINEDNWLKLYFEPVVCCNSYAEASSLPSNVGETTTFTVTNIYYDNIKNNSNKKVDVCRFSLKDKVKNFTYRNLLMSYVNMDYSTDPNYPKDAIILQGTFFDLDDNLYLVRLVEGTDVFNGTIKRVF
jgi:hypothetical protein